MAVLAGGALLGMSFSMEPPQNGPFADPAFAAINAREAAQADGVRTAALTSLVLGGLGLAVGIPLLAANRTQITFD
jgi:hypothetical protein